MRSVLLIALLVSEAGYVWCQNKGTSCNKSFAIPDNGEKIYRANCVTCHGKIGTAQRIGAARLSSSVLDSLDMATIIINGKNRMPSCRDELTNRQVEEVIQYIIGLRSAMHQNENKH